MIRKGKARVVISLNQLDYKILTELMDKIADSASNVISKALQYYKNAGVKNDIN